MARPVRIEYPGALCPVTSRGNERKDVFKSQRDRKAIITTIQAKLGGRTKWMRAVSLYGCQKYSGAKLKVIGARFGISDPEVSQASRRVALRAETDPHLKKMLHQVETYLRQGRVETCFSFNEAL